MSTITSAYRTNNVQLFFDDFSMHSANTSNEYYFFLSTIDSSAYGNTEHDKNTFLEKTLFGKKVTTDHIFYLIKNNRWQSNAVYDQYDDTVNLSLKNNFFMVVYPDDVGNNTSDYRVYKCLFNNYGSVSTTAPSYDPYVPNQIYNSDDGYKWKLMYSISETEFNKYSVRGYIPVIESANTVLTTSETTSNIDTILVENNTINFGYEKVNGSIISTQPDSEFIIINSTGLKETSNYYIGQNFYVTNTSNISQLYEITSYSYNTSTKLGTVTIKNKDNFINDTCTYSIFPRILIEGDGAGAVAIPGFSSTQPNNINRIDIIDHGQGYTTAIASVVNPLYFEDVGNVNNKKAILRPILSPKGGHASNPKKELLSNHALLYVGITSSDNNTIPTSNTYSAMGLVKNPVFTSNTSPEVFDNRIKLNLNTNPLTVGEKVTQIDTNSIVTFSGTVHSVENNDVYLAEYMGPYKNDGGYTDISLNEDYKIVTSQNQQLTIIKNDINTGDPLTVVSPYYQKSGEVFYMASFSQISRSPSSYEEYKIILQF